MGAVEVQQRCREDGDETHSVVSRVRGTEADGLGPTPEDVLNFSHIIPALTRQAGQGVDEEGNDQSTMKSAAGALCKSEQGHSAVLAAAVKRRPMRPHIEVFLKQLRSYGIS
jgi:hypothetical protein